MRQLIDEFGSGIRGLLRSPGFALTAIVVLALGIGAKTAVFSIVNTLLLTPPPFDDPDALVILNARSETDRMVFPGVSLAGYEDFRTSSREFEDIAYFSWPPSNTSKGLIRSSLPPFPPSSRPWP